MGSEAERSEVELVVMVIGLSVYISDGMVSTFYIGRSHLGCFDSL
jgi:hypothetical protein